MGVVYVAVAVLGLLSVGQSAPVTNCESLTRPIEIRGRDQLLGKWIYIGESTSIAGSQLLTKMFVETVWGKITAANESDVVNHYQSQKMFGRCFAIRTNLTVENNTLKMENPYPSSATLLNTGCTDCLVIYSKSIIGGAAYTGLQLLSRRITVSDAEVQEFMKQAECLNLPSPSVLDPKHGFCPEESSNGETPPIDLTDAMSGMASEGLNLLDKLIGSKGGLNTFLNLLSGDIATKQQQ